MQGLVQRADPRKTLNSVPLGVVPCGSGNGLAKSVLRDAGEAYGIAPAAFVVLKGKPLPLDINMYESATQRYVEGKRREGKRREGKGGEKRGEEKRWVEFTQHCKVLCGVLCYRYPPPHRCRCCVMWCGYMCVWCGVDRKYHVLLLQKRPCTSTTYALT